MTQPPQLPDPTASAAAGIVGAPLLVKIGFSAEPVVYLAESIGPAFYSEALARLMMPSSTVLRGGRFIPQLEAQGAIGMLDLAVLELVLDALDKSPRAILGCNISPFTLADALCWGRIIKAIERRRDLASRLVLEITETAPLDEIGGCATRLKAAKRLGCLMAIDDFGTSHATEANLRRLRFDWDIIKLDRSCLGDPRKAAYSSAGFHALARIAKEMAPIVVAEGIETELHLSVARGAGVSFGQGWLFGAATFEKWSNPSGLLHDHLVWALDAVSVTGSGLRGRRAVL